MSFKPFVKISPLRWVLYRLALWRVQEKLPEIMPQLHQTDRILDIGAGNCVLCQQLRIRGFNIVPLDLADLSFVKGIVPVLYDGTTLPFDDDSFDVALVITVLHHAYDPDAVIAQAKRVARRIIIIEDIYENTFEKYFTYLMDSLFNFEFFNHPRSNRTDDGWKTSFQQLRLNVQKTSYSRTLVFMRRVTYTLVR